MSIMICKECDRKVDTDFEEMSEDGLYESCDDDKINN